MSSGGSGTPVYVPAPAPGLGYGGPAIAAQGQVQIPGIPSIGETVTIGTVTLTASTSATSGNRDFQVSPFGTAISLATAINDPGNGLNGVVSATAVGGVVTITAETKGYAGNQIVLTTSNPLQFLVTGQGYLEGGYGEGGEYGYSPYGHGAFPRHPISPAGGYGGAPYGTSSYGSVDITAPQVSSAISLDGYRIEVFFTEPMRADAVLCDPANYTLNATIGAPATVDSVLLGTVASGGGYTSVILVHSGTTTGGTYTVVAVNITDIAGNPIGPPPANQALLYTLGDTASFTVDAPTGDQLDFAWFRSDEVTPQTMLEESLFSPGITDDSNYEITTTYPINLTIDSLTHPVGGDATKVEAAVSAMTSASYDVSIVPADSIVYDGTYLPSDATDFVGTEVGVGTSSAAPGTGLLLSKAAGSVYGWEFTDTSGRLVPGASYRLSFDFDATVASFSPVLFDTVMGTLRFSDGVVGVNIIFNRVAGVDVVDIVSGGFSVSIPATWSSTPTSIELYRNQKADHFAVFINGVPVVSTPTASFTGIPSIAAGADFRLSSIYTVSTFKIEDLSLTASSTIFTTAWNFVHSIIKTFTGSPALANDRILTERGPLVKGWGDTTPATKQDVAVRINGTPVDVESVNPYIGAIFPAIPIPLTPVGANSVEVDYTWFPSPPMEMVGLNTEGLTLNKWNLPNGHDNPPASPRPTSSLGVADTARFPMGVVLPGFERPSPILIGHRYMGFEQEYTASINSPTTLLLNQDPHRVSVPDMHKDVEGASASFEGNTTPPLAEDVWVLDGTDDGNVVGDGTYRLVDALAGSFGVGEATVYYREEGLNCPVSVNQVARFQIEEYEADGVFTGVGFGFHDNFRLYLAGALVVNGVRHVGLLLDASLPHLVDSWEIGPAALGTITGSTTITFPSGSIPGFVEPGTRFQILTGPQAGVYVIASCGVDDFEGVVTVTITADNPFPADPQLEGNDTARVYFEVRWDTIIQSYRLLADVEQRNVQLYIGGTLNSPPISLPDTAAIPAETSLLIPTGDKGRLMFGSFSRIATNTSLWSFTRYDVIPRQRSVHVRGIVVAAEMNATPDRDPNNEWFITNEFGFSEVDGSGDTLLLKSTSADSSEVLDLTHGYARIEPLLDGTVAVDVDATFKVETGVLGAEDAVVRVRNDLREGRLGTLLYVENPAASTYRRLVSLPEFSLSGLKAPASDGWLQSTSPFFSLPDPTVRQNIVTISQSLGESGVYYKVLPSSDESSADRILDARFKVVSWTANANGFIGPAWFVVIGLTDPTARLAILTLKDAEGANPPRVSLVDTTTAEITSFDFDWTDRDFHSLRLVATSTTVSVVADDTVLGTVATTSLPSAGDVGECGFGCLFTDTASVVEHDSFHAHPLPLSDVKRTLGLYKSGDPEDIDSWVIPRTDTTNEANSSIAAVVEEMDWRSSMRVRVHLDPEWGVSVYRPDLPPPPYYTGTFATEITDPTAAWINLEYRKLPRHEDMFGSVAFGALDPGSVTQQRWSEVRYRIYNTPDESYISPHHMVLNQFNVIHSGELLYDVTPEVVTVNSLTSTVVSILSANMNADRVFVVQVDGLVVPTNDWDFDKESQTITFQTALPSDSYPVTITFAPGEPVTTTYLCSQPIEGSVTLLNEGTPPVPSSQQATTLRSVVAGARINDPNDTLNDDPDFILNDPFRTVTFEEGPESLYDCLSFCTVDDGGVTNVLSIACDGPAPESGLIELALEGRTFQDGFVVPGGPGGKWGSSSPVIAGTASSFNQMSVLHASGGNYVDGVLGPGTAVMYPNWPGPNGHQRGQRRGVNQEISFDLITTTPYTDTFSILPTADNTPPSLPHAEDPNPDGAPGTQLHGAAFAETTEYAATGVSRLGPWGGLASLSTNSLLAGGAQLDGTEFILNGGNAITAPVTTTQVIEAAN